MLSPYTVTSTRKTFSNATTRWAAARSKVECIYLVVSPTRARKLTRVLSLDITQMFLADRLLNGMSESEHSERNLLAKLKTECGYRVRADRQHGVVQRNVTGRPQLLTLCHIRFAFACSLFRSVDKQAGGHV